MNCMKCGRETQNDQVFCQDCLLEMEKYPVLPETVVLLPRRKENPVFRKIPKRHAPTPEEQLAKLQKLLRILIVVLAVCITAILLMMNPTLHYILDKHVEIGQNYSTVTNTASTNPASTG